MWASVVSAHRLSSCSSRALEHSELKQLQHVGFVVVTQFQSMGSVVVALGLNCLMAYRIFPDQRWNLCPLHWQAGAYLLCHQRSLRPFFLIQVLSTINFSQLLLQWCSTNFDMSSHFHSFQNIVYFPFDFFSLTHRYLHVVVQFAILGGFFFKHLSVTDFSVNSLVFRKHSLYDLKHIKLIDICFMAYNMVYLVSIPWMLEKNLSSAVVGWSSL